MELDNRHSYPTSLLRSIGEGCYRETLDHLVDYLVFKHNLPTEEWARRAERSLANLDSERYQQLRLLNLGWMVQAIRDGKSPLYFYQRVHFLWLLERAYWEPK